MKQQLHTRSALRLFVRHPDLRVAVAARTLSVLGDKVTLVVLLLHVAQVGEPMDATVLLTTFALPVFALAPLAGRIVDEYDSRTVLVSAAALQLVASVGVVVAPGFEALIASVLLLQAGQSVSIPAWSALTPRIVDPPEVGAAVGLMHSLWAAAGLGGAALGGVLYAAIGHRGALLVDTATFAVVTIAGGLVRTRRGRRYDARTGRLRPAAVAHPIRGGGWSYVRRDALLRLLVPALCFVALFGEAMNVMEVFLIRGAMGASAQLFGIATAVMLLGAIGGPLLAGRIGSDRARLTCAAVATAGVGVLLAAIGLAPTVWVALPLLLAVGFGEGVLNAVIGAVVVTRPPEPARGRTMAALNGALRGCSVFAMALGGLAGQLIGPRGTYVVFGLLTAAVAGPIVYGRRVASPARDSPGAPGRGRPSDRSRRGSRSATAAGCGPGGSGSRPR